MDDRRFDDLARLAATASRRGLLKMLIGAAGGGLLARRGHGRVEAADDDRPCVAGEAGCPGCCTPSESQGRLICVETPSSIFCGIKGVDCKRCDIRETCVEGECERCGGGNCRGCCDIIEGCLPGTSRRDCGHSGQACSNCPDYWRCEDQTCTRCDIDCEEGCCTVIGECIPLAEQTRDACGKGGACEACEGIDSCVDGVCRPPIMVDCFDVGDCRVGCCHDGECVDGSRDPAACGLDGEICDPCDEDETCVAGRCTKKVGLAPLDPNRPDFAYAATRPHDLDGGPFVGGDLGLVGAVSYTGLTGGRDAGAIDERMHDALAPVADQLQSGHVSIIALRDTLPNGPAGVPVTARTDLFEFDGIGAANDALAGIVEIFLAGTTAILSPGGKGTFVSWRGGTAEAPVDNLAAAFRHGSTVGVLQIGTPGDAASVDDRANAVEDVRKAIVRRLDRLRADDYDGLASKIPTTEWVNEASNGGLPAFRRWRTRFYTHADSGLIGQTWQTDEDRRQSAEAHEDVAEAVTQIESIPVNGGAEEIVARIDAVRFKDAASAADYRRRIPETTKEAEQKDPSFTSPALASPPSLPALLDPLWFVNLITGPDGVTTGGVRVWIHVDAYVVGLLVLGSTPVQGETIEPATLDRLSGMAHAGVNAFALAHDLGRDDPGADWFEAWDEWREKMAEFGCDDETARMGRARLARARRGRFAGLEHLEDTRRQPRNGIAERTTLTHHKEAP